MMDQIAFSLKMLKDSPVEVVPIPEALRPSGEDVIEMREEISSRIRANNAIRARSEIAAKKSFTKSLKKY